MKSFKQVRKLVALRVDCFKTQQIFSNISKLFDMKKRKNKKTPQSSLC